MPGANDERIAMIAGTPGHGIRHSERNVAIYLAAHPRVLSVDPRRFTAHRATPRSGGRVTVAPIPSAIAAAPVT
jgi:hypothetical protein